MFCLWSEIVFILRLQLHSPSTVLTFGNRFGFATIVETMDFADEDSDYSEEASDEVNDGTRILLTFMNPLLGMKSMTEPMTESLVSFAPIYIPSCPIVF